MTVRNTAYVHHDVFTHDGGVLSVDLYMLWPEGHGLDVAELLEQAIGEALLQVAPGD